MARQQNIDVYFFDDYRLNQLVRDELIRQYLPKRAVSNKLTSLQTDEIAYDLNYRPRKLLGCFTLGQLMAVFYTAALLS